MKFTFTLFVIIAFVFKYSIGTKESYEDERNHKEMGHNLIKIPLEKDQINLSEPRRPYFNRSRSVRDVYEMLGLPKPRVIIPNWNPNVKRDPWERLGKKQQSK